MSQVPNFLRPVSFRLRQKIRASQIEAGRRVLSGDNAWQATDRMGIPGFGTELLRVDFLPDASNVPAWDSSSPTYARLAAVLDGRLQTRMFCVDPAPRVDLPTENFEHRPKKLEAALGDVIALATPGSIPFFDGSHRSFPGSDVTLFFLELLPALQPGAIVHIHDIFLPGDYPADRIRRYWSEPYLLAAWLLGGACGYEILLPGARLGTRQDASPLIPQALRSGAASGTRFSSSWIRKL